MSALCDRLEVESIHCFAHVLQLIVDDTIDDDDEVQALVNKMKKFSRKLRKSTVSIAEATTASQHGFSSPISVIVPAVQMLLFHIEELLSDTTNNSRVSQLLGRLKNSVETRTSKYLLDNELKTAIFLDCRYKNAFFETSHSNIILQKLQKMRDPEAKEPIKTEEEVSTEAPTIFDRFLMERERFTHPPRVEPWDLIKVL
ncbi:unnamed protein product [Caenorhabditis auriculariae]|uniref:Uncharacterized protein n=1 Tax=Caenorhabditis auriculariae TaxID=2777116 RepID=A0A8S1H860_9PELO|nr:unnamed protein product [Caenorhabditis auriculariae]